jgi:hypothetical protein
LQLLNLDPSTPLNSATTIVTVSNPPPKITAASVDTQSLWPPDHQMVDVAASDDIADNCGHVACTLSVSSSEPSDGSGDGKTAVDWEILDAHHLRLRSERAGTGSGRIYRVTTTCTDSSGAASTKTLTVFVPKSRS